LPDFKNIPSGLLNDLGNIDPTGSYRFATASGCKSLDMGTAWRLADSDSKPTYISDTGAGWEIPDGAFSVAVVSAKRNAEARGNQYLASAGLLGALAIGFMPVAYEAFRDWWRRREEFQDNGPT
jgi:hypothetical protein